MADLDFDDLRELRETLAGLKQKQGPSISSYLSKDDKGFAHLITKREEASMASTATCVTSLVAAGLWKDDLSKLTSKVAQKLTEERTSAGLKKDNPFSLSFMAEGILALQSVSSEEGSLTKAIELVRSDFAPILIAHLQSEAPPEAIPEANPLEAVMD